MLSKQEREERRQKRDADIDAKLDELRAQIRRLTALHGRPHDRLELLLRAAASKRGRRVPVAQGMPAIEVAGVTFTFPDDLGDAGSLSARLRDGWLPYDDLAIVRQFVVGGVMLDIGANIGTTSIPRALLGDFQRIYAAEPNSDNFRALRSNIDANGLDGVIHADEVAISITSGTVRMRRARSIGGHRIDPNGTDQVRCLPVDAWLDGLGVDDNDVAFVKVDAQGWDFDVMLSAPTLIAQRRAFWQIEVHPGLMSAAGRTVDELVAFLKTNFTHAVELAGYARRPLSSTQGLELLLEPLSRRPFVNLLLFNAS